MKKAFVAAVLFLLSSLAALAQDFPRVEAFAGYSYLHTNDLGDTLDFQGGSGSVTFNLNQHLGIEGEIGGYHNTEFVTFDNTQITYLFGPRFAFRSRQRVTPYAHALFGADHVTSGGLGSSSSANGFAMALGGGLDAAVAQHIAVRVIQVDYLLTKLPDLGNNRQNDVRISLGIVFRFGK